MAQGAPALEGQNLPLVASPSLAPQSARLDALRRPIQGPSTPPMLKQPKILVFDSGLGGLTVFREIVRVRPDAEYVYVADDAGFPYGGKGEAELIAHVLATMERLLAAHAPDLAVIACNTASTLVLAALRQRFSTPFIGTVPAIKPACAASRTKLVSVLGTEGTVAREYTRSLIRDFGAGCDINLVGAKNLARYAEAELRGRPVDDAALAAEIAPCFVTREHGQTDTIVLACTHYPLLLPRLETLAAWPVRFIDPAPAIARRVTDLAGPAQGSKPPRAARVLFTSSRRPERALSKALGGFGLKAGALPRIDSAAVSP